MGRFRDSLVAYIRENPGQSDREITNALKGRDQPQQPVNIEARSLAAAGFIERRKRPDGIIGNFPSDQTGQYTASALGRPRRPKASQMKIPACPAELPDDAQQSIRELGRLWALNEECPHISTEIVAGWDTLLAEWKEASSLPLLVRKSGAVGGSELSHATKRAIVPTDNSPAQWACSLALQGTVPSLEEIREAFANDAVPVAFAHKKREKDQRRYHCTLGNNGVNKAGWKLCHIEAVGLRSRGSLTEMPITDLETAFVRLLSPSNYFLLPLRWGGLGEVQEFIEGFTEASD